MKKEDFYYYCCMVLVGYSIKLPEDMNIFLIFLIFLGIAILLRIAAAFLEKL